MWKDAADYVRSLDLDAYLVGGAVRDELRGIAAPDQDFSVIVLEKEEEEGMEGARIEGAA